MKLRSISVAAGFMRLSAIRCAVTAAFAVVLLATGAPATSAQAQKPAVEVPFEFVHNQIVVQVKIGGKGPFNMLVDTNTDSSAIDEKIARELGLAIGSSGAPASGSGTEANTT